MNQTDKLLLESWKSYVETTINDSKDSNLEICKLEIKNWAIEKLSKSYCNPTLLLEVLEVLEFLNSVEN
jgi:hypothetical protein